MKDSAMQPYNSAFLARSLNSYEYILKSKKIDKNYLWAVESMRSYSLRFYYTAGLDKYVTAFAYILAI
jgi:hypothetical protein